MADVTAVLAVGLSTWWHPAQAAVLLVLLLAFWAYTGRG